jgi:hypothetical protein
MMKWILYCIGILLPGLVQAQDIQGAWALQTSGGEKGTLIVNEEYLVIAVYDEAAKTFGYTEGGTYTLKDKILSYHCEFNSAEADQVGTKAVYQVSLSANALTLSGDRGTFRFDRIDKATDHAMAGTWAITERATDGVGELVKIHQTGTRKTLKVLSATRFQWIAIDPAVKGFYGTGGGTYTAKDGKYVENLAFFSRDNSRVGARLEFGWKLSNGRWDHSGKSSKGDPIHETWEKVKVRK